MTRPRGGPRGGAPGRARPDDEDELDAGAHEHYDDAPLYDFEYRRRRADVNHYRRLADRWGGAGPILEMGCGSGRVSIPLLRDGHSVVGLDVSRSMLSRAAARVARLKQSVAARAILIRADMRRFALRARFSLIVCPFNAFQHLYTRSDVEACLASVREHLAPGGRFAFDVLNPDLDWLTRDPRKRWARTRFTHPTTGKRLEYSTNQTYDPVTQIAFMRIYYETIEERPSTAGPHRASTGRAATTTRVVRLAHRQFFPAELEALLHANGFRIDERWGGFDGEPFTGRAESQVILASRG